MRVRAHPGLRARAPGGDCARARVQGRTILEGKQSSAKCCYRYLIGVYDPDKGRLEVADPGGAADTANVFSLQRRLRGDALEGGVSKLSKEEAREALVDGFGSKRVKATHKKRKGQQLEVRTARAFVSLPLLQTCAHSMRERAPRTISLAQDSFAPSAGRGKRGDGVARKDAACAQARGRCSEGDA